MWSEIIGHEKTLKDLDVFVQKPQSCIFYGPSSVGKRTIAQTIAKNILCIGDKSDLCDCKSCRSFPNTPDFLCIGTDNKILVEHIDNVLNFVMRAPMLSQNKVIIVDNCDNISYDAANRLLKVVEESPCIFFFITSNIDNVLPTIQGRCLKFKFDPLSGEDITNILWKKLGFDINQAKTIGWLSASSSADIFSTAHLFIKYRDMAFDLVENFQEDIIKTLDQISSIEKKDLLLFLDSIISIITDINLEHQTVPIINVDKKEDIKKLCEKYNKKYAIALLSMFSNIKSNMHLNPNLSSAIKSVFMNLKEIKT